MYPCQVRIEVYERIVLTQPEPATVPAESGAPERPAPVRSEDRPERVLARTMNFPAVPDAEADKVLCGGTMRPVIARLFTDGAVRVTVRPIVYVRDGNAHHLSKTQRVGVLSSSDAEALIESLRAEGFADSE